MSYKINIESIEPITVYNNTLNKYITLIIGQKYKFNIDKPTNKKDRKNKDRIVEILGFTDNFMGEAIVRYIDNGRRGSLNPCLLIPIK